jgi:hypothetical protein
MKPCVTHHHACDCREREFEKIREQRDELLAACEEVAACAEDDAFVGATITQGTLKRVRKAIKKAIKKAKCDQ